MRDPQAKLGRKALYWHYPHYYPRMTPGSAVREGDWKLIHYYEGDRVELFNLHNDPGETKNLASVQPARAQALRSRLDAWRESVNAKAPMPNPNWRPRK